MSRADLEAEEPFDCPVAVISVRNPGGPPVEIPASAWLRAVLRLEFADVDDPSRGPAMTDEQARRILDFAREQVAAGVQVVCQCEAGVSRSAGIAAALSRIHFGHDGAFHRTHRPNPWVRRRLLRVARRPAGEEGDAGAQTATSEVALLPTTLPTAVLVRDGTAWEWHPRSSRAYPPGTLGGEGRTLAAHVFVPLTSGEGPSHTAREIAAWARKDLHARDATRDAMVIARGGVWRQKRRKEGQGGRRPPEAAVEMYVQTSSGLTRDEWTRALREFADALGARFGQVRFDVVLTEDGLMYKRAVWRPEHPDDEEE
jgi:predicted protein tyrosine phosphatase